MSAADVSVRSLTQDSARQPYKAEFPASGRRVDQQTTLSGPRRKPWKRTFNA